MNVEIEIEKFSLGRIVVDHDRRNMHPDDVRTAVRRHAMGDWGECCQAEWEANEVALRDGGVLKSWYKDRDGEWFAVITEDDRQTTSICFPDDL